LARPGAGAYLSGMARLLITFGIVLILAGLLWGPLTRLGLGRLPGDITIERGNFRLYFPITSSILISAVLTGLIALIRALMR
jgi:hypothetical protein